MDAKYSYMQVKQRKENLTKQKEYSVELVLHLFPATVTKTNKTNFIIHLFYNWARLALVLQNSDWSKNGWELWPTSPHLQGEEVSHDVGHVGRDLIEVVGAHPGGQQGLVGVSERGVREEEAVVGVYRLHQAFGPFAL